MKLNTTMTNTPVSPIAELDEPFVVIKRTFHAPRELVFKAWTDPEQLARWYAPDGCTIEFRELDIREGGTFHSCIKTPGGFQCWCIGVYSEIRVPERIVYSMALADEHGNRVTSAGSGHDTDWPAETIVTVTFTEQGDQTLLTLKQNVRESLAKRTGAYPSWIQMLDHLNTELVATIP